MYSHSQTSSSSLNMETTVSSVYCLLSTTLHGITSYKRTIYKSPCELTTLGSKLQTLTKQNSSPVHHKGHNAITSRSAKGDRVMALSHDRKSDCVTTVPIIVTRCLCHSPLTFCMQEWLNRPRNIVVSFVKVSALSFPLFWFINYMKDQL